MMMMTEIIKHKDLENLKNASMTEVVIGKILEEKLVGFVDKDNSLTERKTNLAFPSAGVEAGNCDEKNIVASEAQIYEFEDYWKLLAPEIENHRKTSAEQLEAQNDDTKKISISLAEKKNDIDTEFLKFARINSSHPCIAERFYTPQMFGEGDSAQCVLVHSNRLQIVTISPYHPIIVNKKTVISVTYESNGNVNRLNNKVSGKFKRGGQKMKEKSRLCSVKCSDGSEYTFISCVRGTLIEVNERLIERPSLLHEKPWDEGYIAIILPVFSRPKKLN